MFERRSDADELMDDLSLSNDELKKNLDEIEILNRCFGSKKLLLEALDKISQKHPAHFKNRKVVIGDLGCGSGDLLQAIHEWAALKQIDIELIGIDANPFIIQYAIEKSLAIPEISFEIKNILSSEFAPFQFDIICMNSVCHHFKDVVLIELFKKLQSQAKLAVIVNDLHRHWMSYFTIKWISKLFRLSSLAQHDGPLSVLRAFRKHELIKMLKTANIKSYDIRWRCCFRWEIIIWCKT